MAMKCYCCIDDSLDALKKRRGEVMRANIFIASTFAKIKIWAPHQYDEQFRKALKVMEQCESALAAAVKEKEDENTIKGAR
jgi:hypothetical protein